MFLIIILAVWATESLIPQNRSHSGLLKRNSYDGRTNTRDAVTSNGILNILFLTHEWMTLKTAFLQEEPLGITAGITPCCRAGLLCKQFYVIEGTHAKRIDFLSMEVSCLCCSYTLGTDLPICQPITNQLRNKSLLLTFKGLQKISNRYLTP